MNPRFRVEWRDEEAFRTVWVFGEVDLAAVGELREALECKQSRLEVDLSDVTFMDLSGLTCLLDAAETRRVVVVGTSPRVDRLLELTDVGDMLEDR
jgi:anti-anti-sigma factor